VQYTGDRLLVFKIYWRKIFIPWIFKYVSVFLSKKYGIFFATMMINISLVFLCINEKNIYGFQIVINEALQWLSFQILGVCWFYCGHWFRSTSSLFVELWCWRDYELVSIWFLLCFFFHFCLLAFVFVLFHGGEYGVVTLFRLCDFVWKSWIWFSG